MNLAKRKENAANAYVTIKKEMNFQDVCFHPKLRKPTTGQLKDSSPSTIPDTE